MRISDWSSDVCSSDLPAASDIGAEHADAQTGMFVARRECVAAGSRDVDIVAGAVVALYLPAIGDVGHQAVGIVEIAGGARRNGQRYALGGGQAAEHTRPRNRQRGV